MTEKSKSYVVQDDKEISQSGFSNVSVDEQEILEELDKYSDKNQKLCMVLCIIFAGAHYYYVGKIGKGLLYTFTGGFLFIGTIIDFFIITSGRFKDKNGRFLNDARVFYLESKLEQIYKARRINTL